MADRIVTFTINPALDVATTTERVMPTEKLRCTPPRYFAGGGGINVARAVHALGGEVTAIYAAGGPSGRMLSELLARDGVTGRSVPIGGITRENLVVTEAATGQQYRFVMPGPSLSADEVEACLDAFRRDLGNAAYAVASGSLPPGVPAEFYARVAQTARAARARLVLDTSGAGLDALGHEGVYLVKPNRRELESLAGHPLAGPEEAAAAAGRLVAEGRAEIVLVSLGADGAVLVTADGIEHLPALRVGVRGAVGAGDSLVAGLVLALARGWALRDSVRYGMAAAAAALMAPGVELCGRADVERLYAAEFGGAG